jgi:hypothetical protein
VSHDGTCFGVRNIKGLGPRIRVVLRIAGAGGGAHAAEGVIGGGPDLHAAGVGGKDGAADVAGRGQGR